MAAASLTVLTHHPHLSGHLGYGHFRNEGQMRRGAMNQAVEAGRLAHYAAHPKAVDALPEPFRSQMRDRLSDLNT